MKQQQSQPTQWNNNTHCRKSSKF